MRAFSTALYIFIKKYPRQALSMATFSTLARRSWAKFSNWHCSSVMKAIACIFFISWMFIPFAQVPLAEIVTENNPLYLTQSEIPNLVFLELLSPADATLLNTYFNSGGQLVNSYQLQGILDREVNEMNLLLQHIKIQGPSIYTAHGKSTFHLP